MPALRHCTCVQCGHCAPPTLYCCTSRPALTKSLISAASSVPVGPPPTCSAPRPHLKALIAVLCACLQATKQEMLGIPALTTTKLRRRRRSSSVVSGRLASSKQALKRSRSALACSASFRTGRQHHTRSCKTLHPDLCFRRNIPFPVTITITHAALPREVVASSSWVAS